MKFRIDVLSLAEVIQGDGPIISADSWDNTTRLDKADSFSFPMPAGDPRAELAQNKQIVRCYGKIQSETVELGAGIIDRVTLSTDLQQRPILTVAGDGIGRELTWRNVGTLAINDGGDPAGPVTTGPALIAAKFPPGWSLDTTTGHSSTLTGVNYTCNGETCLAALVKLAELTGEHFRLTSDRKVIWMQDDRPDSGIQAIRTADPVCVESNPDVAVIMSLEEERDSYDQVTRVYPLGKEIVIDEGTGEKARVTLAGSTWTPPTGFSLSTVDNCVTATAAETSLGVRIDAPTKTWNDIDDPDTLAKAAYVWLRGRCEAYKSYRLSVDGLRQVLVPGSTIHVEYRSFVLGYRAIDINADLLILEAQNRIDAAGMRTVGLTVATGERYPASDEQVLVELMRNQIR